MNKNDEKKTENNMTWKKALGIGTAITAAITVGMIFGLKKSKKNEDTGFFKDLDIPAFDTAHIDELWMEGDDVIGIMHDVDFQDLGEFGKELKAKIPELADKDFVHFPTIGFTKYNAD